MAKKGGATQLQAELNTDEDLENFIMKSGLCLIDIYSEWCGPCLGLISALKKIKLEVAGDSLNLAIAKAEGITQFNRFIRKSEPTWMFIVNQRAVNIAFGADQPVLTKIILDELKLLGKTRKAFALHELQGIEVEKHRAADEAKAEQEAKVAQEKMENRHNYLTFVTDTIMENLPDCAVTIFGSHIPRDVIKKVIDMAESMQIHNKDRRYTTITKEEFETINFDCKNPLAEDVQELFGEEEVLVCFWKLPDTNFKILQHYATELTKHRTEKDENGDPIKVKPLIKAATIKVEYILESDEVYVEPPEPEPDPDDIEPPPPEAQAEVAAAHEDAEGEEVGEEEAEPGNYDSAPPPPPPPPLDFDLGLDLVPQEEEEAEEEEIDYIRYGIKYVRVPAIWVPSNHRAHAALIYVLFHSQTTPFLPPDPTPDPPHIIMIFDAHRRRHLNEIIERNKDKIFYSGFFTSDDPNEAEFIARSPEMYDLHTKSADDKLIVRVNKVTSHMMLTLASYNPIYVSPSVEVGAEEAKLFFPETYKTASAEALEVEEETKRLKKEKKGVEGKELETDVDVDEEEADQEAGGEEEQLAEIIEMAEDGEIVDLGAAGEMPPTDAKDTGIHEDEAHLDHPEGDHDEGEGEPGEGGAGGEHTEGEAGHGEDDHKHEDGSPADENPDDDAAKPEEPKPEEPKAEEPKPDEPANT